MWREAAAAAEFLNRHRGNAVTERLNEVYSRRPAKMDGALHRARLRRDPIAASTVASYFPFFPAFTPTPVQKSQPFIAR